VPGPAGTPGEKWFTGAGAPAGGLAGSIVGDWYLDSGNGDYYEKTGASAWTLRGNLKGPTGAQGIQGVPGQGMPTGGTAGQLLKKNSATNYDALWANDLATATLQTGVVTPPGTTNITGIMAGLGQSASALITPVRSGKIFVTITGYGQNVTAGQGYIVQIRYGTGAAPAFGAAYTGTAVGTQPVAQSFQANARLPFSLSAVITGLTLGTQIWLDLGMAAWTAANTMTLSSVAVCAYELP
jgi:hypothetical protein